MVHSTTKFLNGHSDMVGGILATADAGLAERLAYLQNSIGAVAGPFDSFLALRGLKTLALRMARHNENALAVARWLSDRTGQGWRLPTELEWEVAAAGQLDADGGLSDKKRHYPWGDTEPKQL